MALGQCHWRRVLRENEASNIAGNYYLAALLVLPLLILKFFVPHLLQNEAGKLVSTRQIFEPFFLSHDWVVARGQGDNVFDLIFAAIIAPFWLLLRDSVLVALAGRILCWSLLFLSLCKLARTLAIEWYALAFGLTIWICTDQSLGALEWVFGSGEPKCLAYALLFLALDAVLRKRLGVAGVYCGLATSCHILVGAWGTVALGGALLLCFRDYGWRRVLPFSLVSASVSIPIAVISLSFNLPGTPAMRRAADQLAVLFCDPFHIDPVYFGGWEELAALILLGGCAAIAFRKLLPSSHAKLLASFLAMLSLEFLAGVLARQLNLFWYLKSFPFRVADVLVLLFFLLSVPCLTMRWIRGLASQFGKLDRRPQSDRRRVAMVVALGLPLLAALVFFLGGVLVKDLPVFVTEWRGYALGEKDSWHEMTGWIRTNTPPGAVFLAPPWEFTFWIDAERAQVVSYKRPPHNVRMVEWHKRLTAANGKPFSARGAGIKKELRQNFPELTIPQLESIRDQYGAEYFLTTKRRDDFAGNLVHANSEYWLYSLPQNSVLRFPSAKDQKSTD